MGKQRGATSELHAALRETDANKLVCKVERLAMLEPDIEHLRSRAVRSLEMRLSATRSETSLSELRRRVVRSAEEGRYDLGELRMQVAHALVHSGADVSLPDDKEGETPLHIAAAEHDLALAELLLQSRADPNASTLYGSTPLAMAAEQGHDDMVSLLLQARSDCNQFSVGVTPLYFASQNGHCQVVLQLLDARASVNQPTSDDRVGAAGAPPLCVAAYKGHEQVVRLLLHNAADAGVATKDGLTPVDLASMHSHRIIVQLLTETKFAEWGDAEGVPDDEGCVTGPKLLPGSRRRQQQL